MHQRASNLHNIWVNWKSCWKTYSYERLYGHADYSSVEMGFVLFEWTILYDLIKMSSGRLFYSINGRNEITWDQHYEKVSNCPDTIHCMSLCWIGLMVFVLKVYCTAYSLCTTTAFFQQRVTDSKTNNKTWNLRQDHRHKRSIYESKRKDMAQWLITAQSWVSTFLKQSTCFEIAPYYKFFDYIRSL